MLQNTKYVINLITKYVIKHVTIIKTKTCGLSVACVLDSVMSFKIRYTTYGFFTENVVRDICTDFSVKVSAGTTNVRTYGSPNVRARVRAPYGLKYGILHMVFLPKMPYYDIWSSFGRM